MQYRKKVRQSKVTWKFLCTQVTNGSFWAPLAWAFFGPFATLSEGDEVSGSLFAAWASFSSMSTSSFSKKFKNSWASYKKKIYMFMYIIYRRYILNLINFVLYKLIKKKKNVLHEDIAEIQLSKRLWICPFRHYLVPYNLLSLKMSMHDQILNYSNKKNT